jgi:cytochrome c5
MMKKRSAINLSILLVLIVSTFLLAACGTSGASTSVPAPDTSATLSASDTSPSDGQALLESRCTVCHTTRRITTSSYTADEWTQVVENMINRGAKLNSDEKQTLIEYLAQTYP